MMNYNEKAYQTAKFIPENEVFTASDFVNLRTDLRTALSSFKTANLSDMGLDSFVNAVKNLSHIQDRANKIVAKYVTYCSNCSLPLFYNDGVMVREYDLKTDKLMWQSMTCGVQDCISYEISSIEDSVAYQNKENPNPIRLETYQEVSQKFKVNRFYMREHGLDNSNDE